MEKNVAQGRVSEKCHVLIKWSKLTVVLRELCSETGMDL
jgi:hypothetical protein